MNSKDQIFYTLDGIRGIASILVALRHTSDFFNFSNRFFSFNGFQESYLAVDIFFLMSGVVISKAYKNRLENDLSAFNFTLIRLIRIHPLYLLGTLFGIIVTIINPDITGLNKDLTSENNLLDFSLMAIFLVPNFIINQISIFPLDGPAWSLFFEMVVNIFYGYMIKFLNKTSITIIMLISGFCLVFMVFLSDKKNLDLGWSIDYFFAGFARVFYSFFAGITLYHLYKKSNFNQYNNIVSWLILAAIFSILISSPDVKIVPYFDLIMTIIIFPPLIYTAMLFQPTGISAKICHFFGLISYPIYVLHSPLNNLILTILNKANIKINHYAPMGGIVFLIFLIIICLLIDKYYDLPIRKYLRNLMPKSN